MDRKLIKEAFNLIGKEISLKGWVFRIRKLSKVSFLLLRDGSGIIQCVIDNNEFNTKGLKLESVIEVIGIPVLKNKDNKEVEIQVKKINMISKVKYDLPIEINIDEMEANLDKILNNRVLSLRHHKNKAIFKIQSVLSQGFLEYLKKEGFIQIFTPKIVNQGTEGGTQLFKIKYFENDAYLAQSPQFYKEMMVSAGFERVFEIGQVYRAEEHNTLRHLNEYVSLDMEMAFIKDEFDLMELEEKMLKFIFNKVKKECSEEIEELNVKIPGIMEKIPCLKLEDALTILREQYGENELDEDLNPQGEKLIGKYFKEKYNSDFVFLTNYPRSKRPMYTMPCGEKSTHSFDLIFRGLEITTGGQRIHDYEMLIENIKLKGLSPESYSTYLDAFKYGMPPHGGFAIGLERLTAQLIGINNVRLTTLFPRDRTRINP
ncbi:MAG: aspartate--tRNA(Asn) ligase [Clostridiaceae bacterium]|jgi:nondiscriminating aspartyl-tRNA synthetase|nr:aspartate--tRNA(Asn) ligase [Clostridiaceae bacterium]